MNADKPDSDLVLIRDQYSRDGGQDMEAKMILKGWELKVSGPRDQVLAVLRRCNEWPSHSEHVIALCDDLVEWWTNGNHT